MNVLVAYASRHGATKGIAERIGSTLIAEGLDTTVRSVEEAGDLGPYDAFVIGSAAYMGGWLGQAGTFVRHNQSVLSTKPTWFFSSGPIGTDKVDKQGRDVLVASEPTQFREFEGPIHPRGEQVFFGKWDPDAPATGIAEGLMGRFLKFMPAARQAMPVGDFRDWPAIEAWARGIARQLQAVPAGR